MSDVIVADASPLMIAAKLEFLDFFPAILGVVYIPPKVADECLKENAKEGASLIKKAIEDGILFVTETPSHEFLSRVPSGVDDGEAQAIGLALEMGARLLIDDLKGRKAAINEGISVFGFGVVIVRAKQLGIIPNVAPVLDQIKNHGYHVSPRVVKDILILSGEA